MSDGILRAVGGEFPAPAMAGCAFAERSSRDLATVWRPNYHPLLQHLRVARETDVSAARFDECLSRHRHWSRNRHRHGWISGRRSILAAPSAIRGGELPALRPD